MRLTSKHVGALLGLGFGWLIVQYGFFKAVFVAVLALLGWLLGRIVDGELDLTQFIRQRDVEDLE